MARLHARGLNVTPLQAIASATPQHHPGTGSSPGRGGDGKQRLRESRGSFSSILFILYWLKRWAIRY